MIAHQAPDLISFIAAVGIYLIHSYPIHTLVKLLVRRTELNTVQGRCDTACS